MSERPGTVNYYPSERADRVNGAEIPYTPPRGTEILEGEFVDEEPREEAQAPVDLPLPVEPTPETIEPVLTPDFAPLTFVTVDQSVDAKHAARDAAERRLDAELNEKRGFLKDTIRRAWSGNLAREYKLHKYTKEAEERIHNTGDIYIHEEPNDAYARYDARLETFQRMQSGYDESIRRSVGEKQTDLQEDTPYVKNRKKLLNDFLTGAINRDELIEMHSRIDYNLEKDLHGPGAVRVDNFVELANAAEDMVAHGASIESVLSNMRFISAESRTGARTEARLNKLEKTMEKVSSSKFSPLVSPEVLTAATAVTYSVLRATGQSVLGAVTKVGGIGIASGIFAGLRENSRVKSERAQHTRDMAMGNTYNVGDKRRAEMETARRQTAPATLLTELLTQATGPEADLSSEQAVQAALRAYAEVDLRIKLTDSANPKERIDLISYSNRLESAKEQRLLDEARAAARTTLESNVDPAILERITGKSGGTLKDALEAPTNVVLDMLNEDQSSKDKAFKKLKARRVKNAAVVAIAGGVAFGTLAQEVAASIGPGADTRAGLIEQIWNADSNNVPVDGYNHQTLLNSMFNGDSSIGSSEVLTAQAVAGENGSLNVSGQMLEMNPNGTMSLKDAQGNLLLAGIAAGKDGSLSQDTLNALHNKGIHVSDRPIALDTPPKTEITKGSARDLVTQSKSETTSVTREKHYVNGVKGVSDANERKLDLGGVNGTGVTADGGYEFDINRMTAEGSYNGADSVNWRNAAENGELKLLISATSDTQKTPFVFDIGIDGKPQIPPESAAAKLFSVGEDGRAVFNGKYVEVAQTTGSAANGDLKVRPLATVIGENTAKSATFDIETKVPAEPKIQHEYIFTAVGAPEAPNVTEVPPVAPPVIPRQPLENLRRRRAEAGQPTDRNALPPGGQRAQLTSGAGERVLTRGNERRRRGALSAGPLAIAGGSETRLRGQRQSRPYNGRGVGSRENVRPTSSRAERIRRPGGPLQIGTGGHETGEAKVSNEAKKLAADLTRRLNTVGSINITPDAAEARAKRLFGPKGFSMTSKTQDGKEVWTVRVNEEGVERLRRRNQNRTSTAS